MKNKRFIDWVIILMPKCLLQGMVREAITQITELEKKVKSLEGTILALEEEIEIHKENEYEMMQDDRDY